MNIAHPVRNVDMAANQIAAQYISWCGWQLDTTRGRGNTLTIYYIYLDQIFNEELIGTTCKSVDPTVAVCNVVENTFSTFQLHVYIKYYTRLVIRYGVVPFRIPPP